jgi:hypothetical protein
MSDDFNQVVLAAYAYQKEDVIFFDNHVVGAIKIPRKDTGTLDGPAMKNAIIKHALGMLAMHTNRAAKATAAAAGDSAMATHNERLNNSRPNMSPIAASRTANYQRTVNPTVATGGDPISLAPGVSPINVNRDVVAHQSAAAVAARARPQQRQLKPPLSCPLCNSVVITARGGTATHATHCVYRAFVSLFDLKQRGNVGAARSQCAWIGLQSSEWVRGIRAALKRAEKKASVVVVLETDAVVEKEDGQVKMSFALPRVVKVSEIKGFATRAVSEADHQAMDVCIGDNADGGVRGRSDSIAGDNRGRVTRQCT